MIGKLLLFLIIVVLTASCQSPVAGVSAEGGEPAGNALGLSPFIPDADLVRTGESEMWRVKLLSAEVTSSLTTTRAALQYGGGVLVTTNEVLPERGYSFLLMGLTIEKTGIGRASFSWSDAHVADSGGNVFFRHPNDTFLTHLNIPRLRGTDMVFGHEYGYVCFEIPIGATGLRFIADEGNIVIDIAVEQ